MASAAAERVLKNGLIRIILLLMDDKTVSDGLKLPPSKKRDCKSILKI